MGVGMTRPRSIACAAALAVPVALVSATARAEEHSIIRNHGDHAHYIFEAEPHLILGFAGPFDSSHSVGFGFRGTFHIADGFVSSINDSVGVGVGIDFAGSDRVLVPIVMQWNFWLSTHWSVFGEPGFAIASGPRSDFVPFVFFAGGRLHFTQRIALTMRVGYPELTVGVSFLL
jgi:hypothetical protein